MTPAVVVNAFNRPESLDRLLRSLDGCRVSAATDLVISVDGGGSRRAEVLEVAAGFDWFGGASKVIEHDDLGLVEHFRVCGDLVHELGPLVLLEDDLVVGPNALAFAGAALEFSSPDQHVAGVSLSCPWFDGFRHLRFEPLLDGSAAIYAKVPWFHGMAWTPEQWNRHRGGAGAGAGAGGGADAAAHMATALPDAYADLGSDEWFPDAARHLVASDSWYLLSRDAHAVNFGDAGVHFDSDTSFFQQPLARGGFVEPVLLRRDDTSVVPYDEYLEPDGRWLANHVPALGGLDVTIDLRAVRSKASIATEWVVTSRPSQSPCRTWGAVMHPLEQNLISDVPGREICLCRTDDMETGRAAERAAELTVIQNGYHGRPPGVRAVLDRKLLELRQRWRAAR